MTPLKDLLLDEALLRREEACPTARLLAIHRFERGFLVLFVVFRELSMALHDATEHPALLVVSVIPLALELLERPLKVAQAFNEVRVSGLCTKRPHKPPIGRNYRTKPSYRQQVFDTVRSK
jgi:hypothetical protein